MAVSRDDRVRAQYEAYPYPARDPREERKRLIVGSPGNLVELNHYVFAGRRDFTQPFRVLVAGGGTGDAAVMLAQQLADAGCPAEIVYLDQSEAARRIAEARAEVRGLSNIRFVTASLLDLPELALGRFDYIDCCGVLHHLPDPAEGLRTLAAALHDDGGMGLMVYGELGRIGVYHMQGMMRLLAEDAPDAERVRLVRRLLQQLPPSNWLRRNPFVGDFRRGDDGLFDLFLHSRDRAFRVPEVAALAEAAGLRIAGFIEPARYDPLRMVGDGAIQERLRALPWIERCAFAELLTGALKVHVFYAVRQDRPDAVATPDSPEAVPVLHDLDVEQAARTLKPGGTLTAELEGIALRFPVPSLGAAILRRIDGTRTLDEIRRDLAGTGGRSPDWPAFARDFRLLYDALNGINKLFLAYPASRR